MSTRTADIIRTLGPTGSIEERLRNAALEARTAPPNAADLRHLAHVLTSYSLVVTPLTDLIRFNDLIDTHFYPTALQLLATGEADEEAIHRVLSVPDQVRVLGDKCLFEAGIARRRGPHGLDLEDLGRRSYVKASRILAALADDRRLRRYFEDNALDQTTVDEEVAFLVRCADMFPVHVRLLRALVTTDGDSVTLPDTRPVASAPRTADVESSEATPQASSVPAVRPRHLGTPSREAPAVGLPRLATPQGDPERLADLHLVSRTDEEIASDRFRELVAAEKTVLFSLLDTEKLRHELKRVVIHQDAAIDSLCDELSLYSTGTQDARKPASYFLVGPTGVGKNYLVECVLKLFEKLWGIEVPYLEIEGPEYAYPSDINELKGAARGFIRSDEEGIMTKFHERAHDKPFSVILVDEVEKAHAQLRRFFLAILDRGVMTDNRGRVLHFANTMIFFTSNIGYSDAQRATAPIGFGDEDARDRSERAFIEARVRKTLSPEFINRVHLIHFQHLTRGAVEDIFDLEMGKIARRYREAQGLEVDVTPAARAELLAQGFSHDYGARNLAKLLNRRCNVEVSKILKADAAGDRTSGVGPPAGEVLALVRGARDGGGVVDMDVIREAVRRASRIHVPYRRLTVDFRNGEFSYERG